MKKPAYSFRLSSDLVEKARSENINLADLIEAAIAKKLQLKKCPYCGAIKEK